MIFPFLGWLAVITSAVLLVALWGLGELRGAGFGLLLGWFLIAGCCQFLGESTLVWAAGLLLQTVLAIYLLIRWRMGA